MALDEWDGYESLIARGTPQKTSISNISSESQWLEDENVLLKWSLFEDMLIFAGGMCNMYQYVLYLGGGFKTYLYPWRKTTLN